MTDLPWEQRWHRRAYRAFWALTVAAAVCLVGALLVLGLLRPAITEHLQRGSGEALLRHAVTQMEKGDPEEVIQLLESALEAGFREKDTAIEVGEMLGNRLVQRERYAEALKAYEHVPEGWRSNASQFSGYARALLETGHWKELEPVAEEWLRRAEGENNLTQQIAAHTTLGTLHTQLGRHEAAAFHLEKATKLRAERAEQ